MSKMVGEQRMYDLLKFFADHTEHKGDCIVLEHADIEQMKERGFKDHNEIAFYIRALDSKGLMTKECSADNIILGGIVTIDGYLCLETLDVQSEPQSEVGFATEKRN